MLLENKYYQILLRYANFTLFISNFIYIIQTFLFYINISYILRFIKTLFIYTVPLYRKMKADNYFTSVYPRLGKYIFL
jgi:hypothetical protein